MKSGGLSFGTHSINPAAEQRPRLGGSFPDCEPVVLGDDMVYRLLSLDQSAALPVPRRLYRLRPFDYRVSELVAAFVDALLASLRGGGAASGGGSW